MYVISLHSNFNENAVILSHRMGVEYIKSWTPSKDDIVVVFGAHEQPDKLVFLQQQVGVSYIIMQTEQVECKHFDNKYYVELLQTNAVLDWSKHNVEFLKKRLTSYKVYSFYFFEFFSPPPPTRFEDRPIDFFFAGVHTPTRELMLKEFQQQNPGATFEVDFNYSYTNPELYLKKLQQVKYVINVPFYHNNTLETHRIHRALSAGCEVISLPSCDEDMNRKYAGYVHFVTRLTDFTTLLEVEPRGNYEKLMKEFGARDVEANLRGIIFAERRIVEAKKAALASPPTVAPKAPPAVAPKAPPAVAPKEVANEVVGAVATPSPSVLPTRTLVTTDFTPYMSKAD
jgi:hypothetical protein